MTVELPVALDSLSVVPSSWRVRMTCPVAGVSPLGGEWQLTWPLFATMSVAAVLPLGGTAVMSCSGSGMPVAGPCSSVMGAGGVWLGVGKDLGSRLCLGRFCGNRFFLMGAWCTVACAFRVGRSVVSGRCVWLCNCACNVSSFLGQDWPAVSVPGGMGWLCGGGWVGFFWCFLFVFHAYRCRYHLGAGILAHPSAIEDVFS